MEKDAVQMPSSREQSYGSVLQPVPVIIVGSHYDQIPVHHQQETVTSVQSLVNEVKVR